MLERLRRVTDLFVEGRVVSLGLEDDGTPIVVWVNKPNSFEVEEARRDGMTARADRIMSLKDPLDPEHRNLRDQMERWSAEELREARVNQESDRLWLEVVNDIEGDEAWREKLEYLRRQPTLLDDEQAPDDDARRTRLTDIREGYEKEIESRVEKSRKARMRELAKQDDKQVTEDFLNDWRNMLSLDVYIRAMRLTQIFYALRDCKATRDTDAMKWDHTNCDHSVGLLERRGDVVGLPEALIEKIVAALDDMEMGQRAAGNLDAPLSSSESSESQNEVELASSPSSQTETSPDAPTT